MRSGQALPLDYVPRPVLHNQSSNLAVFSLLPSTISLCSEQTFYLAMRMSEGGVVSETRNPFTSFHLRMESLSHSEWLWCDTSGQSKTPRFAARCGVWIAFLYRGSGEFTIRGR
jgi:hypothetical protein